MLNQIHSGQLNNIEKHVNLYEQTLGMEVRMKTAGIIAEYNPFHNGHKYHIERTREITGADYIIAVMSGNYMQRGVPSIACKYSRAQMALENGVDLVLELPLYYAAGSAEFFALGAVTLLDKLGVTDALCFGSECGDTRILTDIAGRLISEPDSHKDILQAGLKKGLSFPRARALALDTHFAEAGRISEVLSSPNNILGIEYMKALLKRSSSIQPYTITRKGAAYHDSSLFSGAPAGSLPQSSASAIRRAFDSGSSPEAVKGHVPANVYELLLKLNGRGFPVKSNDFSLLLRYKLLSASGEDLAGYIDMNADLSDKIRKNLNSFENYEQFCRLLKSKDTTYSRISRCLLHILLDMRKETFAAYAAAGYIPYARVLGFRKGAAPLMHAIKKHTSIPLVTKLADAPAFLTQTGSDMLGRELTASHIYDAVVSGKFHVPFVNEHSKKLIVL